MALTRLAQLLPAASIYFLSIERRRWTTSIETAVEPGKVSLTQLSGNRRFADERIIICDVVSQGREINK